MNAQEYKKAKILLSMAKKISALVSQTREVIANMDGELFNLTDSTIHGKTRHEIEEAISLISDCHAAIQNSIYAADLNADGLVDFVNEYISVLQGNIV